MTHKMTCLNVLFSLQRKDIQFTLMVLQLNCVKRYEVSPHIKIQKGIHLHLCESTEIPLLGHVTKPENLAAILPIIL